jgi:hypothetical protein
MPPPPPGTRDLEMRDLLPEEAIERLVPVLNDLQTQRLSLTGSEAALLWVLNPYREILQEKGITPEYLARTLILHLKHGGAIASFRPFSPKDPRFSDPQAEMLKMLLHVAVPLWVESFKDLPWEELRRMADEAVNFLGEHGDAIMFRQKGTTAKAFNHLAKSLAILSMVPGGVNFMGMHFETPRRSAP